MDYQNPSENGWNNGKPPFPEQNDTNTQAQEIPVTDGVPPMPAEPVEEVASSTTGLGEAPLHQQNAEAAPPPYQNNGQGNGMPVPPPVYSAMGGPGAGYNYYNNTNSPGMGPSPGPSSGASPIPPAGPSFYYQGAPAGGIGPYGAPVKPAPRRKRTRPIEVAILAVSMALLVVMSMFTLILFSIGVGFKSLLTPVQGSTNPPAGSFSVIRVEGTIQNSSGDSLGINSPSYNHGATVNFVKKLTEDGGNKGILLYMNTPGGGMYEADELYRALETYKEETGRPVWVYMASTCASAGYYISALADRIISNYNTTTGSIGVYIALTDTSGLYEKLGIETVLIRSGENKGIGVPGAPVTAENRAILQSDVDESYERFISIIAQGRGMDLETVRGLADGRPYTANQALELGLVDELGDWSMAQKAFEEHTEGTAFITNFSNATPLGGLLGEIKSIIPRSEAETVLTKAEELPVGVPLSYMPGLAY